MFVGSIARKYNSEKELYTFQTIGGVRCVRLLCATARASVLGDCGVCKPCALWTLNLS